MSFEGNYHAALERIVLLETQLADMTSDYHRWHKAFLDAKYPEMLPTRHDLESERDKLAEALRKACDLLEENHTSRQLCPDEDHEFIAKAMGLLNSCGCGTAP